MTLDNALHQKYRVYKFRIKGPIPLSHFTHGTGRLPRTDESSSRNIHFVYSTPGTDSVAYFLLKEYIQEMKPD